MEYLQQLFPENLKVIYHILFFPVQWFMWTLAGSGTTLILKLIFLFLPLLLVSAAVFCTAISLGTLIFRGNRTFYVATVLIAWWDGGKSILMYWSGVLKFAFLSLGWISGSVRIIIMSFVQTAKDVIFLPMTLVANSLKNYSQPGVPWIAVLFTFFWIGLESCIFTFVLTPLVIETFEALTNTVLPEVMAMTGLFFFLFAIIAGSFACMHGLVEAIASKNYVNIVKMVFIEIIIMIMEVLFFYREFVDSLAPWLAQMSNESIKLGIWSILGIAGMAWMGVRAGTWFFFAKFGTPTLLALISREGMENPPGVPQSQLLTIGQPLSWIKEISTQFRQEIEWFGNKSADMTAAFVLPPVQVLAVMTNFFMILLTGKNLFNIPLASMDDLKDTTQLLEQIAGKQSQTTMTKTTETKLHPSHGEI
ncbi:MAG: hypothetical protein HN576_02920 [Bacteriovoracaceae bacterium]|nr:hypothetical protein [Bacteriovoracaceae bacterium]